MKSCNDCVHQTACEYKDDIWGNAEHAIKEITVYRIDRLAEICQYFLKKEEVKVC